MESENNVTTFTDSIVFDVIKDIASRAEVGLKKYNTTMDREDLIASDWVQQAYEEALDMAIYLKRLKKDMLAMEEELRAFKTQSMIRNKLEEEKMGYTEHELTSACTLTNYPKKSDYTLTKTDGTGIVYNIVPKPNETYTDLEEKITRRNWHY